MNMVYELTNSTGFKRGNRLKDQATGAAISVMNNISEGFDSQSNTEFLRFLRYSRRSVSEVQSCLYVALDQRFIEEGSFSRVYEQGIKTRQLIDGLIRYLKSK